MFADLRHAARALRRAPGFALAAILCLALGVGATTAVSALADSVLLRPLPLRDIDRMVVVQQDAPRLDITGAPLDAPATEELFARRDLFAAGAAFEVARYNLAAEGLEPDRVVAVRTLGDYFGLMGSTAAVGRLFSAAASREPGGQGVAVLGHTFWRAHFGGDPAVVGRTIRLNGRGYQVLGVAAPGLRYPREADLFVPFPVDSQYARQRGRWVMTAIGRVRADVPPARLDAGLRAIADGWAAEQGGRVPPGGAVLHAVPFATHLAGELRPITRLLLAAVLFVLLVACANVACLQLVRATGRARELAVRAAVGAGRGSLVRPLAAESLVIAAGGWAMGVALAFGTLAVLRHAGLARYPQLADVRLDPLVLAFALLTTGLAAFGFGLAPALRAMRSDPQTALRASSRGMSTGADRHRFLRTAVVTQIALALTLTMGAGLLVKSLARLAATDPGFRAEQVVTAQYGLPRVAYPEAAARLAVHERIAERLRATPGVSEVGISMALPFGDGLDSSPFTVIGRPAPDAGAPQPHAEYNIVSDDWFRTMGIGLRRGRAFTSADALNTPPVVLVDEQLAREYFPGEDPIGRRIQQNGEAEIVGVVASVARAQLGEKRKAMIYYSLRQQPIGAVAVAMRGALPPSGAERLLRTAMTEVDRQVPVYDVRSMQARVDDSVGARRLATMTFGGFALVALALAALGVYGVLSYVTAQRTRELGVRAAFGARGADLERMVLGGGLRLAGLGVLAGTLLFLALRRGLASLLYGVGPADPAALGVGAAALAAAVLLASWIPARRAARADPAQALRAE